MRNNKTKVKAIVALMVAVVGLGIGFAAFSSTLTISSGATVTPNASDWNVEFSSAVSCFSMDGGKVVSQAVADKLSISGLEVAFTAPNQNIFCTIGVQNTGKYRAYLTKAEFIEDSISCEALEESDENFPEGYTRASDSLVAEACKGLSTLFTASMGTNNFNIGIVGSGVDSPYDFEWSINDIPADADVLDYSLGTVEDTAKIYSLNISYTGSSARADGPFVVKIPDIKLTYSTVPTAQ